ncbi:MAG: hypothetical protein ACK4IA_16490 [Paracoccus hibiscisoli]|uniref:hypothetical protein n=1 Tax=Paracoccus hibiscisoli TaxID=2023261 RepID=UPI0039195206
MAITTPPPPPNSGNPAQFNERADGFLGWFPTFVSDFNADLPLLRGRTYATRTGTANAIVLTTGGVTLALGMQVRWRAAAANTGAVTINVDGQGAIEARTITNIALPAGYIRTDADTVATYDGTRWIVDRQIERSGNANGIFTRFADGSQFCLMARTAVSPVANSVQMRADVTFPSAFVSAPTVSGLVRIETASGYAATAGERDRLGICATVGNGPASCFFDVYRSFGSTAIPLGASVIVDLQAIGRWY